MAVNHSDAEGSLKVHLTALIQQAVRIAMYSSGINQAGASSWIEWDCIDEYFSS